jgi:hypothetical protein
VIALLSPNRERTIGSLYWYIHGYCNLLRLFSIPRWSSQCHEYDSTDQVSTCIRASLDLHSPKVPVICEGHDATARQGQGKPRRREQTNWLADPLFTSAMFLSLLLDSYNTNASLQRTIASVGIPPIIYGRTGRCDEAIRSSCRLWGQPCGRWVRRSSHYVTFELIRYARVV